MRYFYSPVVEGGGRHSGSRNARPVLIIEPVTHASPHSGGRAGSRSVTRISHVGADRAPPTGRRTALPIQSTRWLKNRGERGGFRRWFGARTKPRGEHAPRVDVLCRAVVETIVGTTFHADSPRQPLLTSKGIPGPPGSAISITLLEAMAPQYLVTDAFESPGTFRESSSPPEIPSLDGTR